MVAISPLQQEQEDYGHIIVKFYAPGSALFELQIDKAAPEQLLAVAETLRLYANSSILERREQQRIQVAKPNLNLKGEK